VLSGRREAGWDATALTFRIVRHNYFSRARLGCGRDWTERGKGPWRLAVRHFPDHASLFIFLSPPLVGAQSIQYCADMCRFTLHSRDRIKLKGLATLDLPFEPKYNIAPSQSVLSLGDFGTGLEARLTTWGLIPSWSADGKGFINARVETLEENAQFSSAI
jgi:hypothetical protein